MPRYTAMYYNNKIWNLKHKIKNMQKHLRKIRGEIDYLLNHPYSDTKSSYRGRKK